MVSFPTRISEFHFPYVITTIYFFSSNNFPFLINKAHHLRVNCKIANIPMGEPEDKKADLDITGKISPVFSCPCCDFITRKSGMEETL